MTALTWFSNKPEQRRPRQHERILRNAFQHRRIDLNRIVGMSDQPWRFVHGA